MEENRGYYKSTLKSNLSDSLLTRCPSSKSTGVCLCIACLSYIIIAHNVVKTLPLPGEERSDQIPIPPDEVFWLSTTAPTTSEVEVPVSAEIEVQMQRLREMVKTVTEEKRLLRKRYGSLYCECKKSRFGPTGGFCMEPKRRSGHVYGKSNNYCVNAGLADYVERVLPTTVSNVSVRLADIGCGTGGYGQQWKTSERVVWQGFDGSENIEEVTEGRVTYVDFAEPQYELPGGPFDWVMSIEVAEHIPKEFEHVFVNNLLKNSKTGIILSWAKKGQGCDGHVNEQNEPWVIKRFEREGMKLDLEMTTELRASTGKGGKLAECPWLQRTLFVFRFARGVKTRPIRKPGKSSVYSKDPGNAVPTLRENNETVAVSTTSTTNEPILTFLNETTSYLFDQSARVHISWKRQPSPCEKPFAKIVPREPYKVPDDYEIVYCNGSKPKMMQRKGEKLNGISVCVPPVYGDINPKALNDWVEHTVNAGVSNFYFYTMDPDKISFLRDTRINILSVAWLKKKVAWERGQMWTIYDCLHRIRSAGGRWAIFLDFDEYLYLPKYQNLSTITKLLDGKFHVASFGKVNYKQKCRLEYPIKHDPSLPFLCSTLKQHPNVCEGHHGERKYIVDVVATRKSTFKIHEVEAQTLVLNSRDAHLMHCRGKPFNQTKGLDIQTGWMNKRQIQRESQKMLKDIQDGKGG
mmetsp:Transcript_14397/g.34648  ORF Transcript_14397/g.34648 Transcript_14397/m.34648 type:complete len:689 (+) Transcript_14397:130-2196(+)